MSEKVEFKKLREFGDIINDTIRFFKENFKPLLRVFIYFCGAFILAGMAASIMQQIGMQKTIRDMDVANTYGKLKGIFSVSYFLVFIIAMLNYTAMTVSVTSFIALYIEKGNTAPTVDEVWGYFKYYFLRVLGSSVLLSMLMIFSFALCLLPGIYMFPAISLMIPVMIFENGSLGYAFSHAFKLLKEQWWITAATLFILWIITYATTSFASLPAIILTMVSTLANGSKGLSNGVIIFSTILQYLCQVFMIIPIIGIALCYFNLSERQNSGGLMERIQKMGQHADPFANKEEY
ncbi:hypothetical protein TH53_10605 [Pedobacter lusitanus]|uniref:Glycerophosphoryl diester phosphodiesterase membrane domain-containing protein n=1 Tax=Pedobacter lusitanus TaxID=1503925 RepID=A0A0D0GM00_9SPHI|nr:hypothetical protein [Pedobacter lusitanus]KIO77215.1 hypothetical protein TH53_10605 [Pedobacter lusitanus]